MYVHAHVRLPPFNLTPPSYLPPFQSHPTLLSPSLLISLHPPIPLPSNLTLPSYPPPFQLQTRPPIPSPSPHPTLLSTSHPTSPYPPTNSLSSPLIQAYGGVDTRVSMVKGSARVVTYAIVRYSEPHVHVHEWVCIVLYVCTVCVYVHIVRYSEPHVHVWICTVLYKVWLESLAGNLFWQIGGFERNLPIFHLPKLHSVMSSLLHNHSFHVCS